MIERKKNTQYFFNINTIIKECQDHYNSEEVSNRQLLMFLVGDYDQMWGGDYTLYKYERDTKKNFIQRLNMLWVFPIFLLTIPLQYLFYGSWGLNKNSKVGKFVDWLVGFSKGN